MKMVTLILGKTLVFWAGILAGIFFFGGLLARIIINKSENIDIVKKKRIENLYQCEICGLVYKNKNRAEKCEKWCEKNKSCNIDITKHAIKEK